ncbi:MAG: hypothetical protein M1829_005264 [Trizodia sp. TS-e1964]|nr:MAG: hypothetical protein M1829_005264 [Trizodia sp. TS-e1964]
MASLTSFLNAIAEKINSNFKEIAYHHQRPTDINSLFHTTKFARYRKSMKKPCKLCRLRARDSAKRVCSMTCLNILDGHSEANKTTKNASVWAWVDTLEIELSSSVSGTEIHRSNLARKTQWSSNTDLKAPEKTIKENSSSSATATPRHKHFQSKFTEDILCTSFMTDGQILAVIMGYSPVPRPDLVLYTL